MLSKKLTDDCWLADTGHQYSDKHVGGGLLLIQVGLQDKKHCCAYMRNILAASLTNNQLNENNNRAIIHQYIETWVWPLDNISWKAKMLLNNIELLK